MIYNNQTHRPIGAPPKAAPVCLMDTFMDIYGYVINIDGYISYTFLIYSTYIYIYFLDMFHVFSLVCFLTYGVKRRQVLIAKPCFSLSYFSDLHLVYFY